MNLTDFLHCPACKGRLVQSSTKLCCTECNRTALVLEGIADFVGSKVPDINDPQSHSSTGNVAETASPGLLKRIQAAAGDRWPQSLGQVLELNCGHGYMSSALLASVQIRSLLAIDTDMAMLRACHGQLATLAHDRPDHDQSEHELLSQVRLSPRQPDYSQDDLDLSLHPKPFVGLAALDGYHDAIRDAVADTVIATTLLSMTPDVRGLLTTVHRVLKPGGRALFVVPNRRYRQALCHAMATALARYYAREGAWPEGHDTILAFMAQSRHLLVHQDDADFLTFLSEKHLFDSDALEDLGKETGFVTAEMRPLDFDPVGHETARRICQSIGLEETAARTFASQVATAGQPFFNLLSRQGASASMLLWLTKSAGPCVTVFNTHPPAPPLRFSGPEAALDGVQPRWSLELLARDSPEGIDLLVRGWCLANIDVVWIRITLESITLRASVWRSRADVHEVLNRTGLYHPLNALCSGIETQMLFDGVHPQADRCALRFDIVLANGLTVSGPAPETITMNKQLVIAH